MRALWAKLNDLPMYVTDFGVVMDGASATPTDNTAALQRAVSYCRPRGIGLTIPDGDMAMKGPLYFRDETPDYVPFSFLGQGKHRTRIYTLGGWPQVQYVLSSEWNDGSPQNTSFDNKTIGGFTMQPHPSVANDVVHPAPLSWGVIGNTEFWSIRCINFNNTVARHDICSNVKFRGFEVWDSGISFEYKSTKGITFTATAGSDVVQASAPLFAAADVGKQITVHATNAGMCGTIVEVIDSTHARLSVTSTETGSGRGGFGTATTTAAAGASSLTFNSPVFKPAHAGLWVYLSQGGYPGYPIVRTKITEVTSSSTIKVNPPVPNAVNNALIALPVTDFHNFSEAVFNAPAHNDILFDDFWVEQCGGVMLVMKDGIEVKGTSVKLHGNWPYPESRITEACAWFQNISGYFNVQLAGFVCGPATVRTFSQVGTLLRLENIEGLCLTGMPYIRTEAIPAGQPAGGVVLGNAVVESYKKDGIVWQDFNNPPITSIAGQTLAPLTGLRGGVRYYQIPFVLQDQHGHSVNQGANIKVRDDGYTITLYFAWTVLNVSGLTAGDTIQIALPTAMKPTFGSSGVLDFDGTGENSPRYLLAAANENALRIKGTSQGRALLYSDITAGPAHIASGCIEIPCF